MVRTRSSTKAGSEPAQAKKSAKPATPKGVQNKAATKASAAKTANKNKKAAKVTDVPNTKSEGVFENPAVIGDEDFLSNLPTDCIDGILKILNQNDLDTFSCVSQTLKTAAEYARPRAVKRRAENFSFTQMDDTRWLVVIGLSVPDTQSHRAYRLPLHRIPGQPLDFPDKFVDNCRQFSNGQVNEYINESFVELSDVIAVPRKLMDHLLPRLERFAFESYAFDSLMITAQFLEDFKKIGSRPLQWLRFRRCLFDKKLSAGDRNKFLSLLLAAKPGELVIDFPRKDEAAIFDDAFILRYAETVANPRLTLLSGDHTLTVNRELSTILTRFDYLEAMFLVLSPELLLEMILHRLEKRAVEGEWKITVSARITDLLLARVNSNKYTLQSDYAIQKKDTGFEALFTFANDRATETIEARVLFNDSEDNIPVVPIQ